jgi:hypothetical protein
MYSEFTLNNKRMCFILLCSFLLVKTRWEKAAQDGTYERFLQEMFLDGEIREPLVN